MDEDKSEFEDVLPCADKLAFDTKKEAQATAKVDLDKITGSRNDKKEELAKAQWQMKENTLSRRKQHETTLREKKNSLDRYLEECKQKKALHTQTTNEECQRLDKERDAQLKAEGIDPTFRS